MDANTTSPAAKAPSRYDSQMLTDEHIVAVYEAAVAKGDLALAGSCELALEVRRGSTHYAAVAPVICDVLNVGRKHWLVVP